jgi:4-diphosphocytidyl-2-C-methyl-D-erythritol kinase
MTLGTEIVLNPPAKVNLFLDVGPLRPDGYHEIISIMQTIDLRDRLTIRLLSEEDQPLHLHADHHHLTGGPENTLWRAHQAFKKSYPPIPGMEIRLRKRIPMQAGLGGGSSDAGILLRYLWKTFAPGASEEEMIAIAAEVGSDVPFFLFGGTCLVKGRGEQIASLPSLPSHPILVFHPVEAVSTAAAYQALDATGDRIHPSVEPILEAIHSGSWKRVLAGLHNSFEECIYAAHPPLAALYAFCQKRLREGVLLCGSGSNLFAASSRIEDLHALQQEASSEFPGLMSTLTQTVNL